MKYGDTVLTDRAEHIDPVCDAGEKQIQRRMLLKTTIERLEEGCRHEALEELDKSYDAHDADAEEMVAIGNRCFHKKYKGIPRMARIRLDCVKGCSQKGS